MAHLRKELSEINSEKSRLKAVADSDNTIEIVIKDLVIKSDEFEKLIELQNGRLIKRDQVEIISRRRWQC